MSNNILIIDPGKGWGHFVSKIYSLRELSNRLNKKIIFLTKSTTQAKSYLENQDFCESVCYLSNHNGNSKNLINKIKNFLNDIKTAKNLHVNSCYIFHPSIRYVMIANFAGIKNIYGLGYKLQNFFIKKKNKFYNSFLSKVVPDDNETKEFVKKLLNLNDIEFKPFIKPDENKKYIAVGIGASEISKRWPIENYIKLIEYLIHKNNNEILVVSGKDQIQDEKKIKNHFISKSVNIIFTSNKKISEVIPYMKKSKIYIGNDTGFAHLFINCSIKSYIIYGSCVPQYYSKLINHIVHDKDVKRSETSIHTINLNKVVKSIEREFV